MNASFNTKCNDIRTQNIEWSGEYVREHDGSFALNRVIDEALLESLRRATGGFLQSRTSLRSTVSDDDFHDEIGEFTSVRNRGEVLEYDISDLKLTPVSDDRMQVTFHLTAQICAPKSRDMPAIILIERMTVDQGYFEATLSDQLAESFSVSELYEISIFEDQGYYDIRIFGRISNPTRTRIDQAAAAEAVAHYLGSRSVRSVKRFMDRISVTAVVEAEFLADGTRIVETETVDERVNTGAPMDGVQHRLSRRAVTKAGQRLAARIRKKIEISRMQQ